MMFSSIKSNEKFMHFVDASFPPKVFIQKQISIARTRPKRFISILQKFIRGFTYPTRTDTTETQHELINKLAIEVKCLKSWGKTCNGCILFNGKDLSDKTS